MEQKTITIKSPLAPQELLRKLNAVTLTDLSQLQRSPGAIYYGDITPSSFTLMNVRYGPMSSFPPMQGEVKEEVGGSAVAVTMDIRSQYELARKMYYTTLVPLGLIVLLLTVLVLGGTEYQMAGYIFSGSFIACAVLVAMLTRSSLVSARRREVGGLAALIDGRVVAGAEAKRSRLWQAAPTAEEDLGHHPHTPLAGH